MATAPAPPLGSAKAHGNHAARAQDERRHLIRIAHLSSAKPLDDDQHDLLCQIVGGSAITQVLQPV